MMTDAPHGTKKKKGKTPHKQGWFRNDYLLLIMSLLCLILCCGFLSLILYHYAQWVESPLFSPDEVFKTCQVLALPPDSVFCTEVNRQTHTTLQNTLKKYYPPGSTTLDDLRQHFAIELNCYIKRMACSPDLPVRDMLLVISYNERKQIIVYEVFSQRYINYG